MKTSATGCVYFQGCDVKGVQWCSYFSKPVVNVFTLKHLFSMLFCSCRQDVIVFRYQNNPKFLVPTVVEAILVLLNVFKAKLFKVSLVWICHNVDQDTQPNFKVVEKIRRAVLMRLADFVLVLDSAFLRHLPRRDALVISFGAKPDGYTSAASVEKVSNLSKKVDMVVLIAGQDGGKYKAFSSIPEIFERFNELGIKVGFATAGMSAGRYFDREIESVLIRLPEKNLRESDLAPFLSFIYRENSDISMPYTVYAAATAGIPILTREGNIIAEIVRRESIGLCLQDNLSGNHSEFKFTSFLERHNWSSLSKSLRDVGVQV